MIVLKVGRQSRQNYNKNLTFKITICSLFLFDKCNPVISLFNFFMNISLTDRPGRPQGPLEVSDVHKEGCKLKWDKPKDDGGLPIDGYVVEKMDVTTGTDYALMWSKNCMYNKLCN